MSRRKKYATDEERQAARREARRRYYHKNIERERARSLTAWRARQEQSRQRPRAPAEPCPLQRTIQVLGPSLLVDHQTPLDELLRTLREDLLSWSRSKHPAVFWEYLTKSLIAQQEKETPSTRLDNLVSSRITLFTAVRRVAIAGEDEAWRRNPPTDEFYETYLDEYLFLGNIANEAAKLRDGVEELVNLYYARDGKLSRLYEEKALYWQTMEENA
ncbi:hypothetical protein EXIGLDRAFT_780289 [Exidia glandulosa HHB12029]|uniref:Uncharacterized protein n=1 Tax=Exidia glandulosa HHB12029 TaxID=1314781 RepID=A0A165BP32_EXIGL|nr:hypothetical protein EXIGLDRAFT_780289 [Exidia glandulosa HHB12029]